MIDLRRTHRILALVASVFALELARVPVASGHALAPSLLEIRELEGGRAEVLWKQPAAQPMGTDLRPALPAGCRSISAPERFREELAFIERGYVECGGSLVGRVIGIEGIEQTQLDVLLRLVLADGRSVRNILNATRPAFVVPEKEGALQVATSYGRLGVEHILTGFDHLLFVFGLVLLVGGGASLLWTVTAFTVGHSITLALAVLGFVNVPQGPIEAVIALTIYILAVELVRTNKDTLFHRQPWLMAGVFGMLHGLGFAGALAEVGLPAGEIPLALFSFNVGIEAGQIAFVAVVLLAGAAVSRVRFPWPHRLSFVPAYGIGCLAAFWFFERTAAVLR
jgi:hypothetical protein